MISNSHPENLPGLIPSEAYLLFPADEEIKIGKTNKAYRRIYEGQIRFDEYELKMIAEFKAFLQKNKYTLDPWWVDMKILRFLYANNWKFEKAFKSMISYTDWSKEKLPPKLTNAVKTFLESGLLYVHGRDHRFRPIVVFQAYKLNIKELDLENILDSVTYLLNFVIEQLMLPGQVENWVFIIDLNKTGLSDLPISKIMSYMQNNFRSRLYVMYIVQAPTSINFMWGMIKGFLEENTQRKIQIIKQIIPENLFKHANKEQIERKYGGSSTDIQQQYWPPIFPSKNYFLPVDKLSSLLISPEDYRKMVEEGILINNKICSEFMIKPQNNNNLNEAQKNEILLEKQNSKNEISLEKKTSKKEDAIRKANNTWVSPEIQNNNFFSERKAKTNIIWDFEYMTVGDENPKIVLSSYLNGLANYKTKEGLEKTFPKIGKKKTKNK